MTEYKPNPIDTSQIQLPEEINELTERLAESTHDHWALMRMREGWTWGPRRNDEAKEHPDLVPYSELDDEERQYDRRTAMETLKAIIALGYEIRKGTP